MVVVNRMFGHGIGDCHSHTCHAPSSNTIVGVDNPHNATKSKSISQMKTKPKTKPATPKHVPVKPIPRKPSPEPTKPKIAPPVTLPIEPAKRGKGRPQRDMDLKLVESLGEIQCTMDECSSVLKIPKSTLSSRPDFSDAFKRGLQNGKISLRRLQFKHAKKSYAMCIWLGKQWLGQSDKNQIEVDNKSFQEIKTQIETVYLGRPIMPTKQPTDATQ